MGPPRYVKEFAVYRKRMFRHEVDSNPSAKEPSMFRSSSLYRSLILLVVVGSVSAVTAQAGVLAQRTFVSRDGLDTNACTFSAPCRNFSAAVDQTIAGGEVVVLDSAGYGPVTLAKSISLISPAGVYAGISTGSGVAITIAGTAATDIIILKGLTLEGRGSALTGVELNNNPLAALHVEDCVLHGFVNWAIHDVPSTDGSQLYVRDTTARESGNGIEIDGATGITPFASIDHCRADRNQTSGFVIREAVGVISDSVAAGNASSGIGVSGSILHGGEVTVTNCIVAKSSFGITTAPGFGTARLANNTIIGNGTGVYGTVQTRISGDPANPVKSNTLSGNSTDGTFSGTYSAQ
jgi:copper-binding protein NosD